MRDEDGKVVSAKAKTKPKLKPKPKAKVEVEIKLKPKPKPKVKAKAKVTPTLATYVKPRRKPKRNYGNCASCDLPLVSLVYDSKAKKPQRTIICNNKDCSRYRMYHTAVKLQ